MATFRGVARFQGNNMVFDYPSPFFFLLCHWVALCNVTDAELAYS